MLQKELKAESPISRGIQSFLVFCRMEKGLSLNSLDAYARDLEDFRRSSSRKPPANCPEAEDLVHIPQRLV